MTSLLTKLNTSIAKLKVKPISVPIIDKLKSTAITIKTEKIGGNLGLVFYPTIAAITKFSAIAPYAAVCFTWHRLVAYNNTKQIIYYLHENHYDEYKNYIGKKVSVKGDNLLFSEPSILNILSPSFKKESINFGYYFKQPDILKSQMNDKQQKFVDAIIQNRKNRFRIYGTSILMTIMTGMVMTPYAGVFNGLLFIAIHGIRSSLIKEEQPINQNFVTTCKYYYVDYVGNICFTDKNYGIRKRYENHKL
jgi:hypothetical protein